MRFILKMLVSISLQRLDGRDFQIQEPADANDELYVFDSLQRSDWLMEDIDDHNSLMFCFSVAGLWDILECFHAGICASDRLFCRLCIPWSSTSERRTLWVLCGQTYVSWQQPYKQYSRCTEVYPRETQMFPAGLHCNSLVWKGPEPWWLLLQSPDPDGVDYLDVLEIQVCCGGNLAYMVMVSQQLIQK